MNYTDIHIHALYGADDGARTEEQMRAMIDASYADGVRTICFTPHFHPGFFGDNREKAAAAFEAAQSYVREKYSDMRLFLGNELRYSKECIEWLDSGACRTMNNTNVVLVDFLYSEPGKNIIRAMNRILNAGYRPLLAHVERYVDLKKEGVRELSHNGVWLQVNAASVTGGNGFLMKRQAYSFLKEHLVDFVSSDAHNTSERPPVLSGAYHTIEKKFGRDYARAICYKNALQMLSSNAEEGMVEQYE